MTHVSAVPLSGRSSNDIASDMLNITSSSGSSAANDMMRQEQHLEQMASSRVAFLAELVPAPSARPSPVHTDRSILEPYLLQLKTVSEKGMSDDALHKQHARCDETNAEVAATDVGEMGKSQHPVAFELAGIFGLNRKQRLAFYTVANGMLRKKSDPTAEPLRLYIGGGAGSGQSHVLRCIKAFKECPVKGQIDEGRMLTVAFQGKQAAGVGGTTVHSVCQAGTRGGSGNLSGKHDDQKPLSDTMAVRWKGVVALAIEEVSMVGCELLVALNKAADEMFPMSKSAPFGNLTVVFCGDFNQLRYDFTTPISSFPKPYTALA